MPSLVETMNRRAPSGTLAALVKLAKREKKRPAEIVREAVLQRLAEAGVPVAKDAA